KPLKRAHHCLKNSSGSHLHVSLLSDCQRSKLPPAATTRREFTLGEKTVKGPEKKKFFPCGQGAGPIE
ncbi:MAG: hypothetical protein J6S27_00460, partial [Thermoguttaceae bacterium]|nr:hypothetical protein [Thermoguttaceae bacterium]